jgi:hypothetical protein
MVVGSLVQFAEIAVRFVVLVKVSVMLQSL